MDPLTIASLISAIAGSAMQYSASQDAAARQRQQIQDETQRQQAFQRQAEQTALNRVQDYDPQTRRDNQQQIEQQVTDNLMQPVQQAQPAMQDQSSVQGDVSSDYTTARARSQADQMNLVQNLARIMGKITGANRLRQDEALKMLSTGQQIDQLKNFAQGSQGVNQLEVQQAGVPDGGTMLAGGLLQTLGSVGLMKGLSKSSTSGASNVWAGANPSNAGSFRLPTTYLGG